MHEGQVEVPVPALRRAIADQFPDLADLPVRAVPSAGTVIAPFRVGEDLVARLPLVPVDDADPDRLRSEGRYADVLARVLPVSVPRLVATGQPFPGYPGTWSMWTWLPGRSLDRVLIDAPGSLDRLPLRAPGLLDLQPLADDLAAVLRSIHQLPEDAAAWTDRGRGGRPLADSEWVRTSIRRSAHLVDPDAATSVWESALAAPAHDGPPVPIHGDPMPGNLLLQDGRLTGLVDISEPVVGDPAADLQPAWVVFDEPHRGQFRQAMGLDDAAWARGRGWAFEMAIGGLHYYEHTNPMFFRLARRTLDALLSTT